MPRRTTGMPDRTYRVVILLCRVLFRALGLRIEVLGATRLPEAGPVVVAANHNSFLDFMLVGLVGTMRGRLIRFLAKEAAFQWAGSRRAMRAMRHIPVDRSHGEVAARTALRALRAGEAVGIYPEATIGRAFEVKSGEDFRIGAAHLALATGAPLVPVAHWGLHRVMTVDGRRSLRRGTVVRVVVGEPLVAGPHEDAGSLTTRLHGRLAELVAGLIDTYPQAPARPGRTWWWPASRGGAAPTVAAARVLDEDAVARADSRTTRLR